MPKTRIGVVDYLNARPLVYGLDRERGVELVFGSPADLGRRLLDRDVEVALTSSIECFLHREYQILPDIGVCSEGPVRSIKLYLRTEPENVKKVALDSSSRSAALLTRLVFLEFFQRLDVEYSEIAPTLDPETVAADAVLLIGDAALRARPGKLRVIDLGALWTERTGLPFVYAVWTCHRQTKTEELQPLLLRARDRGLPERPRIAQQAAKMLDLPAAGLVQYLTKNLRYQLGEREIKGLERFRDLGAQFALCEKYDVPFVRARVQMA